MRSIDREDQERTHFFHLPASDSMEIHLPNRSNIQTQEQSRRQIKLKGKSAQGLRKGRVAGTRKQTQVIVAGKVFAGVPIGQNPRAQMMRHALGVDGVTAPSRQAGGKTVRTTVIEKYTDPEPSGSTTQLNTQESAHSPIYNMF